MPIFFAPRLWANSDPTPQILARIDTYAQAFHKMGSGQEKIIILALMGKGIGDLKYNRYKYLKVVLYKRNLLGKIKIHLSLIRSILSERTVISGDPYFTFWFIWLYKKLLGRKIRIQISVHGFPLAGDKVRFINLRLLGLRSASRKADSVRVVSQHLSRFLQENWGVDQNRIFVAPIPVQIPGLPDNSKKKKQILILGRMHEERGILLSVEIALKVLARNGDVSLVLIGDGPLRSKVESIVDHSGFKARVKILGRLPHSAVFENMSESWLLLSSAPEEGFGLAIREAAYAGLFVVALSNLGTKEARQELSPALEVFSTNEEAITACERALENQLSPSDLDNIRSIRKTLNQESLRKIALSWL